MAFHADESMTDFNQLFNFDQATTAPSQAARGKTVVSPQFTAPGPENAYLPPQSQPTFQGPSHQYELFRQHTSIPPGAFTSLHRTGQMPTQSNYTPMSEINDTDGSSFNGMDMDFQDMFDANSMNGFVDPSSVGVSSDAGDASPVARPAQRLWPGMHQQHAAAKEQQKKMEQQRLHEQQRKAIAQQQLGTPMPAQAHQRRPSQARNKSTDPLVEERISQILRSMRQNNNRANASETPQPVMTQPAKQRKDEEDMDEDERLLASEEGKKLSSKERRQLRNKVSARAFRSRRKEYISQLEGELQVKTNEADDLQSENDALRAENAQLTDLARMLLSQPAFSNVLEDLAARGSSMPAMAQQTTQHRSSVSQTSQAPVTVAPIAQQPTSTPMDFSTPMDGWNSGITAPDFNFNPNVFAVTELPEPVIETSILSGKGSALPVIPELSTGSEKKDYPVITTSAGKIKQPVLERANDSSNGDLYATPVLSTKPNAQHIELVSICTSETEADHLEQRFASICESLDAMCLKIEGMTSRS